ncbi:MAG: diaminobutyrate-2-oxoglutarate transaminase [Acidobacteriota bacterium]|nr:diaminobutyrate-2-oxoglutarate transaminase [Acidobacteriota bacterium]
MSFESYHLTEEAAIVTENIPGPNSLKLLEKQRELEANNRSYPQSIPVAFERALGSIIEDIDGNQYIDFFAGCGVLNLGHNNKDVMADMEKQQKKMIQSLDFPTRNKVDFMEELDASLPDELRGNSKFNFCGPAGTDAIEAALKLAKINTGRHSIISFQGAYHGMTSGALSVTAHLHHRKKVPSLEPGVHFMPYCYCYRCAFGKQPDACRVECAQYVRISLENPCSGIEKPAAIIVEPVQGEGGTIIPKEGFLEELVQIGHDLEIPLIFDEIQSGFYRTGPFFSFENFRAVPDIITISKGLGGIGMPIAMVIYKKNLDTWEKGTHAGTFRGNQLSIAAAASAIRFAKSHHIEKYVKELGKEMLGSLVCIQKKSKFIGEVRGIGMFFGIEYVKNPNSKEPFPEMAQQMRKKCFENGLLVELGGHYSNVVRFLPPLITTPKIVQKAIEIFEKVNNQLERELG